MGTEPTIVIVGAGQAGATAAKALRRGGHTGRLVLIGDEGEWPYERPPLSKNYLRGRSERDKLLIHPPGWYAAHRVELHRRTRVTGIDRATHRVSCDAGEPIHYDKLLLATGASPRALHVPGADPHRVFGIRRIEDTEQLRATWRSASRVAIVGAGWIGLEVAAAARQAGLDVTVLEAAELPLARVLGREVAEVFADLHRRHGVDLRLGVQVSRIVGDRAGLATAVVLGDGDQVDADVVVVGVGASPNTELAERAGLMVDNGIRVDEHLRSSDPDIYAAGDVANAFHPLLGTHIRVEHWANAVNQATVAARAMLGGDDSYDRMPYFYSDQYELGMEYSGYVEPGGYDQVVFRGDKDALTFIAFWLKERRVVAGMNVNVWDQNDVIHALVRSPSQVDPAALADEGRSLEDTLAGSMPAPGPCAGRSMPDTIT